MTEDSKWFLAISLLFHCGFLLGIIYALMGIRNLLKRIVEDVNRLD